MSGTSLQISKKKLKKELNYVPVRRSYKELQKPKNIIRLYKQDTLGTSEKFYMNAWWKNEGDYIETNTL